MFKLHIEIPSSFDTKTKEEFFDQAWVMVRAMAMEAYRRVIMKTPVDTGRARANWGMTTNEPNLQSSTLAAKASIGDAISALKTVAGKIPTIYISNNVIYMDVLEFGWYPKAPKKGTRTVGGFSKQAPRGIIAPTVEELAGFMGMS